MATVIWKSFPACLISSLNENEFSICHSAVKSARTRNLYFNGLGFLCLPDFQLPVAATQYPRLSSAKALIAWLEVRLEEPYRRAVRQLEAGRRYLLPLENDAVAFKRDQPDYPEDTSI